MRKDERKTKAKQKGRLVSKKMYEKYKDYVLKHSNPTQRFIGPTIIESRGKSAKELAQELGLTEQQVEEILLLARKELLPLGLLREAEEFQKRKARKLVKGRQPPD